MGWAGGPSSAAGTGPLSWPCLPLDGGSDAVCPPPSCLRLGVVSVVSFFVLCAPHPSSPFLFIVLIRAGGFVLGRGTMPPPKRTWVAQLPQPRGGVWEQRHHPATPGLDTVPGVGLTLLLEYMGMGQSSHCPTGHVCPHRLFKEHNDSLVDHVPKEREALLEREFQRVTISGEEKCGVSLPPDPSGTQARVSRLPTPAWGVLFVWCPLSRCPSPTCWMRPRAW